MGNVGRIFCVALPFLLTLASLVTFLIAGLAGVANKSLYVFEVNTTDLSVNPDQLSSLVNTKRNTVDFHDTSFLDKGQSSKLAAGNNLTAADLGLANLYEVSVWGYCAIGQDGNRSCGKTEYNWASLEINSSIASAEAMSKAAGVTVTIPKDIEDGLSAFSTAIRWTEILFIIACISLGIELLLGLFSSCSRVVSCVTWLIAGVATVAVCGAAALATATAAVAIGVIEADAKKYGITATFNWHFLAIVWLSAALALGSGFFWLFTICCCAPDHHSRRSGAVKRDVGPESEKFMTGAYQPIHDPEANGFYPRAAKQQYGVPRYESSAPRSDLAYEPYSHANV